MQDTRDDKRPVNHCNGFTGRFDIDDYRAASVSKHCMVSCLLFLHRMFLQHPLQRASVHVQRAGGGGDVAIVFF